MQPTHLNGAQLFSLHIFSFEILTFIEIEIDITTGGHQLKIRFLFFIVYKNGLFQIVGFSSYPKKLGMSNAYQKFCRGRPLLRCT